MRWRVRGAKRRALDGYCTSLLRQARMSGAKEAGSAIGDVEVHVTSASSSSSAFRVSICTCVPVKQGK